MKENNRRTGISLKRVVKSFAGPLRSEGDVDVGPG